MEGYLTVYSIVENQLPPAPSGLPDVSYQYVGPLLSDLTTGFNSAIAEPASIAVLGVSLIGVAAAKRRG